MHCLYAGVHHNGLHNANVNVHEYSSSLCLCKIVCNSHLLIHFHNWDGNQLVVFTCFGCALSAYINLSVHNSLTLSVCVPHT